MMKPLSFLRRLRRIEQGQDLAEYALLIALIAVVVIGAVMAFGGALLEFWNYIGATFPGP